MDTLGEPLWHFKALVSHNTRNHNAFSTSLQRMDTHLLIFGPKLYNGSIQL